MIGLSPSLHWPLLGTMLIGAAAGLVGTFAVIRRRSLQGDAISHAALPGVGLAYLLGGRTPESLAIGAAFVGGLAMLAVGGIVRQTRLPYDTVLGGTLAVFFGLGLSILEFLRSHGAANHGLERFLFGQAALIGVEEVVTITAMATAAGLLVALLWKQLQIVAFDLDFARTSGIPTRIFEFTFTTLLVASVVIGMMAVGVVLMSALLIAPAVSARQWTHRLGPMTCLATLIGASSSVAGTLVSHEFNLPTGPAIVLSAIAAVMASLLRGVWR